MKQKRVAIYSRCSTDKQEHSISNQLNILREYCDARRFKIEHEFFDEGFTGRNDQRPALKELLVLVRKRKIDAVIVVKLDRLFRSLKHLVLTLDEFTHLGVEFISVEDQLDLTSATGKLTTNLLACMAEFESDLLKSRTIAGIEQARKRGVTLGRPKLGIDHLILQLRNKGMTYQQIQDELKCSRGAVCRAIKNGPKTL